MLSEKSTRAHIVVPNLLNRGFKQDLTGKVLLTDITYLPYGTSNMAYLSTIKDASTNEILSYKVSNRLTLDIATETIEKLELLIDGYIDNYNNYRYQWGLKKLAPVQ